MTRIKSFLLAMFGTFALLMADAQADGARAYISIFQSGQVVVVDIDSGAVIRSIPVQDRSGIAVVALSTTTGRLFVVDGADKSRLRVFDPRSFAVVEERAFEHRVLNFSDVGQLHLSRDGSWLFLYTYSYPDAAIGLRIFDIDRNAFVGAGLRERGCLKPVLTSTASGSIFTLCPGLMQDIGQMPDLRGGFAVQASVETATKEIEAAAATPDGRHLYAVGPSSKPDGRWQLVHWDRTSGLLEARDLATILDASPSSATGNPRTWLGIPSDARKLVLVQNTSVWLIDRESLKLSGRAILPSPALSADLVPDGASVLTLHTDGPSLKLVTTPLSGGTPRAVALQTPARVTGPATLAIGPLN